MTTTNKKQEISIDAECSVIGALILDNDVYDRISDIITPSDFYHPSNRLVYQHIQKLANNGTVYDVVTLEESLASDGLSEQVGGIGYLAEIAKNVPTARNIKYYAEIVKNKAIKRKLSKALLESNEMLHGQGFSEEEVLDKVEQIIEYLDEVAHRDDCLAGLTTGFMDLDDKLGGLKGEQLIIVAGRPAMGKTTFAMNIAEAVLTSSDKSVLLFSMEMSAQDIMMRMTSSLGLLPFSLIRSGKLDDGDWPKLTLAFEKVEKLSLSIVDKPALTPEQVRHKARKFKRENPNLGLIVIDY